MLFRTSLVGQISLFCSGIWYNKFMIVNIDNILPWLYYQFYFIMKKIFLIFILLIFGSEKILAAEVINQILLDKKKEIFLKYIITRKTYGYTLDTQYYCFLSKRFVLKNNSSDSIRIVSYNFVNAPQTRIDFRKLISMDTSSYTATLFLLALCPPFGLIYLVFAIAETPYNIAVYKKQLSEYKKHYIKPFTKEIKPGRVFRFNTLQPYSCEDDSSEETCMDKSDKIEIQVMNLSTKKFYNLVEPDVKVKRSKIIRTRNFPEL